MSHPRSLLEGLLSKLRVEFDDSLEWVIERRLRVPGITRSPDIAAYEPSGSIFLVVEVGYTDAKKLEIYRAVGCKRIRWYSHDCVLQYEETAAALRRAEARELERYRRLISIQQDEALGALKRRALTLEALDLWNGATERLRALAAINAHGLGVSASASRVLDLADTGRIDLGLWFPAGWVSLTFASDCLICDEAAGAEPAADATEIVIFDASGYLHYFECEQEEEEHSFLESFVTWDDEEGLYFEERATLFRQAGEALADWTTAEIQAMAGSNERETHGDQETGGGERTPSL